jgi:nicotinic acid mononucleotide adenylyltransferase
MADLVVLPRDGEGAAGFAEQTLRLRPDAVPAPRPAARDIRAEFALPGGNVIRLLAGPCLEISSSVVRERFLAERDLNFLVPPGTLRLMREKRRDICKIWSCRRLTSGAELPRAQGQ